MRVSIYLCVAAALAASLTGQQVLIPAGGLVAPIGVLSDAQGRIYTSSQGDGVSVLGSVAVYDPVTATQSVVISNLPTFMAPPQHPVGAHHMAWHPTQPGVLSLVSGGPTGLLEDYDVATGTVNASFDVGTFIAGQSLGSNAYSVANDSAGNRYVVDTGANAIVKVDTAGTLTMFAQFPNLPATGGIFVGQQFVPTKIVADGSDGFWVGGLSGVPFSVGAASVAHVDSAGVITMPYTGLTTIVDLAVSPHDNSLHALSIGSFDQVTGGWVPGTGEVIRLGPAGNTTLLGGLNMPTGMTFAPNGDLYYVEYLDPVLGPGAGSLSRLVMQASKITYGVGCYETAASFYEVLTTSGMDLGGMKITGTATSFGYDITTAASGWTGPGPTATVMALGDDDFQDSATVGGTLGVWVGSNGNIALNGANSSGFTPSVSTMLTNPETGIYAWTDLQPLSGGGTNGDIFYEENGTVATVTYNGVDGWNTGDPNSIQFTYDTATGDFSILFGTVSSLNPEDWLIGYSVGGPSLDGGPTDISAGAFSTPAADTPGLALDSNAPVLGGVWDLQLNNTNGWSFIFFGDTAIDPGVDLTPLGAPGCFVYTSANLASYKLLASGGVANVSVSIPNDPALNGASLAAQGTAGTALNALTIATSNGLLGTFGL